MCGLLVSSSTGDTERDSWVLLGEEVVGVCGFACGHEADGGGVCVFFRSSFQYADGQGANLQNGHPPNNTSQRRLSELASQPGPSSSLFSSSSPHQPDWLKASVMRSRSPISLSAEEEEGEDCSLQPLAGFLSSFFKELTALGVGKTRGFALLVRLPPTPVERQAQP